MRPGLRWAAGHPGYEAVVERVFTVDRDGRLIPLAMADRLGRDAPAVTHPSCSMCRGTTRSFRAPDKVLQAYPGRHGETPEQAVGAWCRFVAERLGPSHRGPATG